MTARALLLAVALVIAAAVAYYGLAEATQTRNDHLTPGTRSEVVVEIETRAYRQDLATAAHALWGTCAATVGRDLVGEIEPLGDRRFRLVTSPALGRYGGERLVGCLNDLTIDRVRAEVVSSRDL